MEHTKRKLEVSGNGFENKVIITDSGCMIACTGDSGDWNFLLTEEQAEANAKELVRRWNAFEKDGLVDELRAAADEGLAECERVKMDCKCKWKNLDSLLGRIERIEAAIAKVKA